MYNEWVAAVTEWLTPGPRGWGLVGGSSRRLTRATVESWLVEKQRRRNKDILNQEKAGRRALSTGMFLFVKPKETCSKQHFFHFFCIFSFSFFFDCTMILRLLPKVFEPRQRLAAGWHRPDSDWRSDRMDVRKKKKREYDTEKRLRRRHFSSCLADGDDGSRYKKTIGAEVQSEGFQMICKELNAPVDVSAVASRLMNHANLLEASHRGCRQGAVDKGQIQTLTILISPNEKYSHMFISIDHGCL